MKDKHKARSEFEAKVYAAVRGEPGRQPMLFVAGELGICLLEWRGLGWRTRWFDKMETLKDSEEEV